jgi:putative aldouronate transport system substrate-binding protein
MRKDIVDKYHIDVNAIRSLDDLDTVFKTVKDNQPNLTPLVSSQGGQPLLDIVASKTGDLFADRLGYVPFDGKLQIADWFESKEYAERIKTARRWFEAGYVSKNIATSKETGRDLVKANAAFSYLSKLKPGKAAEDSLSTGMEMVAVPLDEPLSNTSIITNTMMSIPTNAKNPERSMMFLDLLYHDKDLINLVDYGIEGKHYVKKGDNKIGFPAGVDATNSGYNLNESWMFGNQFLSYIWETNSGDLYQQLDKFNKSARKSDALGFTYDINPVKTQVANITNVMSTYRIGLESGTLNPDEALPQFISKLKEAGIDTVIATKQQQLVAWKSTK